MWIIKMEKFFFFGHKDLKECACPPASMLQTSGGQESSSYASTNGSATSPLQ